jgi:hypothetical protein
MERALITLTSSESKRLIGRAIANLPEVKKAFREGIIFIALSTSSAYVAEELLNIKIESKGLYAAGVVVPRGICATSEIRLEMIAIKNGVSTKSTFSELRDVWLPQMGSNDVFIKGVNAIDSSGLSAIFLGNPNGKGTGGHIAAAFGILSTRGVHFVIAGGIEKLVPGSLADKAPSVGGRFKYSAGMPSGMILVKGQLITEVEAIKILTDTDAVPIAAGGINGAEGCHTFIVTGSIDNVDRAWELFKSIKGEPPLTTVTLKCDNCDRGCDFNKDSHLISLRRSLQNLKV